MANAERLRAVLAVIEERAANGPDEKGNTWDQTDWAIRDDGDGHQVELQGQAEWLEETCNTAMCFAGWTCHLFPEEVKHDAEIRGFSASVATTAKAILGLTDLEGSLLFATSNEVEDLRAYVAEFTS